MNLSASLTDISSSFVSSLFNPPNIDQKFIDSYNQTATNYQAIAQSFNAPNFFSDKLNQACIDFYNTLGTKIDQDKDLWEGLNYEEILTLGKDRLLFVENKKSKRNFFLNPPEAGHNSGVIHYSNSLNKSMVLNALEYGNVWILDKRKAKPEYADLDMKKCIERSVKSIDYIFNETKEKVNVAGFCQGGWESFIAAYLMQNKCKSVATGGSPFNWHSEDLSDLTREMNPAKKSDYGKISDQRKIIENLINKNEGLMPGLWNLLGFIYFSKDQLLFKDIQNLWECALENDHKSMQRFSEFRAGWFMIPQTMGGKYFLDIYDKLYTENQLFKGNLNVLGEKIDLKKFKLPIYCLNGTKDNITSRGQQMDLFDKISSSQKKSEEVEAGHIGVFNSSRAMPHWNNWFEHCKA